MKYLFLPLNQHSDNGFGATGEAFEHSAKVLSSNSDHVSYHYQIPLCFLYRHAIELYLKSAIVVLHRALAIPYDKNPHDGPAFVLVNKKWKPIYQVHSVAELWGHVLYLTRSSKSELERRCKTDWQAIPPYLITSIEEIERIDGRSTFFRYPDFQRPEVEQEKSNWKPKTPDELQKATLPGKKPALMLLMIDQNDQVTEGFQYDDKTLAEALELLRKTADTLSGLHLGLRMELAGGF